MIPLAYGSLLGGSMTLIGTPPNIIVSDLLLETGYKPFTFFQLHSGRVGVGGRGRVVHVVYWTQTAAGAGNG
ncbi:MAG: hypothetical protein M5U34_29870 [Chloroflexi bacterium]|nr:hypothetical protein [Chloroflexota bacterium]